MVSRRRIASSLAAISASAAAPTIRANSSRRRTSTWDEAGALRIERRMAAQHSAQKYTELVIGLVRQPAQVFVIRPPAIAMYLWMLILNSGNAIVTG